MNSNFSTATTAGRGVSSSSSSSSSNRKRRNDSNNNSTPSSSKSAATTIFRKYSKKYCIPLLLIAIGIIGFIQISMYNIVLHNHSHSQNKHGLLSPYQQRQYFEEERLKRKQQQETKIQQLQHHTHNRNNHNHHNHPAIKLPTKNLDLDSSSSSSSSLRHHHLPAVLAVGHQKQKQKPQQQMKMRKELPKKKMNDVNKKEEELEELEDVDIHLIRPQKQKHEHEQHQTIKNESMTNNSSSSSNSSIYSNKGNSSNITTATIITKNDYKVAAVVVAAAKEEEEEDNNNNEQKLKEEKEKQKDEQEQERVLQQEYDSNKNSNSNSENKIIHIIHTRFMQHYKYTNNTKGNNTNIQGNTNTTNTTSTNYLTILGQARLKQFLTFCLPTIQKQTNQNFLWIIKIDPLLAIDATANEHENIGNAGNILIFQPLIDAINNVTVSTGQDNMYIVGSNFNYNIEGHGGSWRDGQEGEELLPISLPTTSLLNNTTSTSMTSNSSNTTTNMKVPLAKLAKVYTGDMIKLRKAYDLREKLPILETRLDADDGLQYQYIERIQTIAIQRFLGTGFFDIDSNNGNVASSSSMTNKTTTMTRSTTNNDTNSTTDVAAAGAAAAAALLLQQPPNPKWLYWCIQTQMEWHSDINTTATNSYYYYGSPEKGYLSAVSNQKYCITPGVTIGYNIGINGMDVPQYQHTKLWMELHSKKAYCHDIQDKHHPISKGPCLIVMGSTSANSANSSSNGNDTNTNTNNNNNDNDNQMILHAIRSRTLTSAGMNGIVVTNSNHSNHNNATDNNINKATTPSNDAVSTTTSNNNETTEIKMLRRSNKKSKSQQQQQQEQEQEQQQRMESILFKLLYYDYGIEFNRIIDTQHFLQQNSRQIAYENWLGQCSNGHSCKLKAKNDLYRSYNK